MSKPYEELSKDNMIIVSNAGPIIALARIGKLDLLKQFTQIYIPNEVYEQVVVKKSLDDLRSKRVWISEKVYNRALSGIKGK